MKKHERLILIAAAGLVLVFVLQRAHAKPTDLAPVNGIDFGRGPGWN